MGTQLPTMARATFASLALLLVTADATLTTSQEDLILNRHNKLRSETAKGSNSQWTAKLPCTAADMEKMVWDSVLATEAQTYADQCIFAHPAEAGKQFGENLWM